MRKQLRLLALQLPLLFVFAFVASFPPPFLKGSLERLQGAVTDLKFHWRGARPPQHKIIIVAIDDKAIDTLGRWPWHRELIAEVIEKLFESGVKVVGLDTVFAEPEHRVPEGLIKILEKQKLASVAAAFEGDPVLADTIRKHAANAVLGWTTESPCVPALSTPEECPVTHPEAIAEHPRGFDKFSIPFDPPATFNPTHTSIMSLVTMVSNISSLNQAAQRAGFFNAWPDLDGTIRRTPLLMLANGKAYPTLALAMAEAGLQKPLQLKLTAQGAIESLGFQSQAPLAVAANGDMSINFRGPAHTYPYVSAADVVDPSVDPVPYGVNGEKSLPRKELLKDAYAVIGATAVGLYDMRSFPMDPNVAGAEGHATILDNILSGDALRSPSTEHTPHLLPLLAILGGLIFSIALVNLGSLSSLLMVTLLLMAAWLVDTSLFSKGYDFDSSLLYLEIAALFALNQTAKYVLEERQKKFVQGAFGKYVSPKVVETLINNPEKLKLGGERRDITVLFSDIRGFTDLSEKMDPRALSAFLNEYLGLMTSVIVRDFNGTLDKYIGDAIMAFWGAPLDDAQHPTHCVQAAIQMQKTLREKRLVLREKFGLEFQSGIGFNAGAVSVGNMGSEQSFSYTAIGDTVNLASRLEGLTRHYGVEILTTGQTYEKIAALQNPGPSFRRVDRVKVKGRNEAIDLIEILSAEVPSAFLQSYEAALKSYFAQDWARARQLFTDTISLKGSHYAPDAACKLMADRCEKFLKTPPAKDWDGRWEMKEK